MVRGDTKEMVGIKFYVGIQYSPHRNWMGDTTTSWSTILLIKDKANSLLKLPLPTVQPSLLLTIAVPPYPMNYLIVVFFPSSLIPLSSCVLSLLLIPPSVAPHCCHLHCCLSSIAATIILLLLLCAIWLLCVQGCRHLPTAVHCHVGGGWHSSSSHRPILVRGAGWSTPCWSLRGNNIVDIILQCTQWVFLQKNYACGATWAQILAMSWHRP